MTDAFFLKRGHFGLAFVAIEIERIEKHHT
jgi:hypothetical protein